MTVGFCFVFSHTGLILVTMGNSSDDSSEEDISESEIEEYEDKSYEELKNGNYHVKASDQSFSCPYCSKKRKRDFLYKELLQHATGVGKSSSEKRSIKDKANHLALAKYLEKDMMDVDDTSGGMSKKPKSEAPLGCDHDEKFMWPWTGVVVNIPTELRDGRYVGGSGSKLRDELTARGFNPKRVHPLWNYRGHSGCAVVEFNRDWPGLHNAISFEKEYEANRHGKKDWIGSNAQGSGLYGWVARADDYNAESIIGEHLRKNGDLKTISEIMAEEARKQSKLVSNLTNVIEAKNKHLEEMKRIVSEASVSLNNLIEEKEKLHQAYNEGGHC